MGPGQTRRPAAGPGTVQAPQPVADGTVRRVTILGATGSVGQSTLDVIGRNPHLFEVAALTANSNAKDLAALARHHRARLAVVADESRYAELKASLSGSGIE